MNTHTLVSAIWMNITQTIVNIHLSDVTFIVFYFDFIMCAVQDVLQCLP